jgi:hypothetical protein
MLYMLSPKSCCMTLQEEVVVSVRCATGFVQRHTARSILQYQDRVLSCATRVDKKHRQLLGRGAQPFERRYAAVTESEAGILSFNAPTLPRRVTSKKYNQARLDSIFKNEEATRRSTRAYRQMQ